MIVDIYSEQIGQMPNIDELLMRLKGTLDQEVGYMKSLLEVLGTMDTLFAASQHTEVTQHAHSLTDITPSATAKVDVTS